MKDGIYINLSERELDKNIYRIVKQNYVFSLFQDRKNILSQPHNWKDKFENFQLKIGGIYNGEKFTYAFKNDFVGQCWTMEQYSEAMWGIYANDPNERFIRIRSTPRKLLAALAGAHPKEPHDTRFLGKVEYIREAELRGYLQNANDLNYNSADFARSLLLKRKAFKHEKEVRLLYFGSAQNYDKRGLYGYDVDPHAMITQLMADPNRDRKNWSRDKLSIRRTTGFSGTIKRSKMYDAPEWNPPNYN